MQARYTATLVWVVSFLFSQTRADSLVMLVAALPILFPISTSRQLLLEVVDPISKLCDGFQGVIFDCYGRRGCICLAHDFRLL